MCASLFLGGCAAFKIPLRTQYVNDDIFPTSKKLLKRVRIFVAEAKTRTNFTPEEAFKIFGGNEERGREIDRRCDRVMPEIIHGVLYPNSEIRGSMEEQQNHSEEMQHKMACIFKVKHIPQVAVLDLSSVTISLSGHDHSLVFVFDHREDGHHPGEKASDTAHLFLSGRAKINEKEVIYYWEIVLTTLEGFLVQGGKSAGGAVF